MLSKNKLLLLRLLIMLYYRILYIRPASSPEPPHHDEEDSLDSKSSLWLWVDKCITTSVLNDILKNWTAADFPLTLFRFRPCPLLTSLSKEKFVAETLKLKVGINISKFTLIIITINLMTRWDVPIAYNWKECLWETRECFPNVNHWARLKRRTTREADGRCY